MLRVLGIAPHLLSLLRLHMLLALLLIEVSLLRYGGTRTWHLWEIGKGGCQLGRRKILSGLRLADRLGDNQPVVQWHHRAYDKNASGVIRVGRTLSTSKLDADIVRQQI